MQVIQTIRDKGAAIVIAVIALSLIGFLLMDAKSGGNNISNSLSSNIGKVNGEAIERSDFEEKIKQAEVAASQQQYGGKPEAGQIREQVWNSIIQQNLILGEAEKAGLGFSAKELNSLFFSNDQGNPFLQANDFINPETGKLDSDRVSKKLVAMKKAKGEEGDSYNSMAEQIKMQTIYSKYVALLNGSAYYPGWMQEKDKSDNKNFANITYVAVPYTIISDSTVKVSDTDIETYVAKHKNQFKQEEGRMISYVAFSQLANKEDSAKAKEVVSNLKTTFATDTNPAAFLARNGSLENFSQDYVWKSKMQRTNKDSIMLLDKGAVYGPYIDGKNYTVAKMVNMKQQADSVRCRHILIKIADLKNGQIANQIRPDTTARRLIDSIANAVKNGADFNALVLKYSEDMGSKATKGEYSFTYDNNLVDSFYRTVFYEPVGTKKVVLGVDNSTYVGFHYIEVLNQFKFEPAYQIAYLSKEILASETTIQEANNNATKLSGQKNTKEFESYVAKNGLQKISWPNIIKENDFSVGQLKDGDARRMIKWVFEAKQGNVSEPYNIGDQFVVVNVENVASEGVQDAKTARSAVENAVRNQKKAEIIIKNLGNNPTLENAAAKYNKQVDTAGADSSLTFNSQVLASAWAEPKVIGAVFNKENQKKVSTPIEGGSGVFLIKVNSIVSKPADAPEKEAEQSVQQKATLRNQAAAGWLESLKKMATIKDNRSKFY